MGSCERCGGWVGVGIGLRMLVVELECVGRQLQVLLCVVSLDVGVCVMK